MVGDHRHLHSLVSDERVLRRRLAVRKRCGIAVLYDLLQLRIVGLQHHSDVQPAA